VKALFLLNKVANINFYAYNKKKGGDIIEIKIQDRELRLSWHGGETQI
jgi:hypothetical protein